MSLSFQNNEGSNLGKYRINTSQRNNKTTQKNKLLKNNDLIEKLKKKLRLNNAPESLADVFGSTDHIQYLNLDILAKALTFCKNFEDLKIPNNYDELVDNDILKLSEKSGKNDPQNILKLKATYLRYINCYIFLSSK
jgi:hypothetical protein